MAVGTQRNALLLCLFDCLGYVSLPDSQIINRPLTFFDHMMKVNDRRMFLSAMTTSLLRLVCDPLYSVFISTLSCFLNNLLSVSFVPLPCIQLLLGLPDGLVLVRHQTPSKFLPPVQRSCERVRDLGGVKSEAARDQVIGTRYIVGGIRHSPSIPVPSRPLNSYPYHLPLNAIPPVRTQHTAAS